MDKPQPHLEQIEERVWRMEEALRQKADQQDYWELEQQLKDLQGRQEQAVGQVTDLDDRVSDVEGRLDDLESKTP
jgi:predicted  nucleic acid-binding Zn-ribbon protein